MTEWVQIGDARWDHLVAIYALCDHPSGEVRYIGKTEKFIIDRFREHERDAKRSHLPVHIWLRSAKSTLLKLIEHVDQDHWQEREKFWIKKHRESGRLLNQTSGGQGRSGSYFSKETREKIASSKRTGDFFLCEICSSKFWRKKSEIYRGECRFCSKKCYQKSLKGVPKKLPLGMAEKGVKAAAKKRLNQKECKRGHPLYGDNVYLNKIGARVCKECRKVHKAKYRGKI